MIFLHLESFENKLFELDFSKFQKARFYGQTALKPVDTIRFQGSDSWFRKFKSGVQTVRFQGSVFVVRMSEGHS